MDSLKKEALHKLLVEAYQAKIKEKIRSGEISSLDTEYHGILSWYLLDKNIDSSVSVEQTPVQENPLKYYKDNTANYKTGIW